MAGRQTERHLTEVPRNERLRAARLELMAEADISSVQNTDLIRERRQQICDAAVELFLEKGFAATTIRDICARSGVNQASIYDYVANKNDILRRVLNQLWFREDVQTLPEILLDRDLPLEEALARYFRESWAFKRKASLLDVETDARLQALERAISHENRGAGIGFVVAGRVVDRSTLTTISTIPSIGKEITSVGVVSPRYSP